MYLLYTKSESGKACRFTFQQETHFFGCRQGLIPKMLRACIGTGQCEPWEWHLRPEELLPSLDYPEHSTLIIDLKPDNATANLSLYEVMDVWGRSSSGWTPIMVRLRGLFVDADPKEHDRKRFTRGLDDIEDPIFTILLMQGSVDKGSLFGTWNSPGPSPTNSALLWPETLTYFMQEANAILAEKRAT